MVKADGVISRVVRNAEVKDPDTVVEALEDGALLGLEDARRGDVSGGGDCYRRSRSNELGERDSRAGVTNERLLGSIGIVP